MLRISFLMLLLFIVSATHAQKVTVVLPKLQENRFNLNDLQNINLINNSLQNLQVFVEAKLRGKSSKELFSAKSSVISLIPGINHISKITDPFILSPSQAMWFSGTGDLNPGSFILSLIVKDAITQEVYSHYSVEKVIMPVFPPVLIYPSNGQEINTLNPVLQWLPPIPLLDPLSYSIKLVEVMSGENIRKAFDYNFPLLERMGLTSTQLLYNFMINPLEWDKTYAWQVKAWYNDIYIGETEIWTFAPVLPEHEEDEEKPKVNDSYWIIGSSSAVPSGFYISSIGLKFTWYNKSRSQNLNYQIIQLSQPYDTLSNLPVIPVKFGINYIDIPKDELRVIYNTPYMITVKSEKGEELKMKFKLIE